MSNRAAPFDLTGRVIAITGGAGLLGREHARAIASAGGTPVVVDIAGERAASVAEEIATEFGVDATAQTTDITNEADVSRLLGTLLDRYGHVDGLINNAADNPKMEADGGLDRSRLEQLSIDRWNAEIAVGLTGAFICSRVLGSAMARRGHGTIVNIASDLAVIAPDQRLYREEGLAEDDQPVKPVTYSVVKAGLIGLTRYLATYWAVSGVRVNALSPGGVEAGQPPAFVQKLHERIPLARMARRDEYHGAVVFLCSDASSYMTGHNLVVDGGRTVW